jgi:hypothetical protein
MIFDVPRISTTLRNSLSPTNSTVIYNTDTNFYEYYNGTSWKIFGEGRVISFNTRNGDVTLLDSDIASLGDFTVSGTLTINNDIILGSQALKFITSSTDPNVSGVSANTGSIILKDDGTLWQKLGSGNTDWSMIQTSSFTNEPTGFPINSTTGEVDRTSSTISFDNNSRTFSIAPSSSSWTLLIQGRQYRKTTTETIQLSIDEGPHYIYYDYNAILHETTSFSLDLILHYAVVAIVYWDSTNNQAILFGDERHGCTMDSHTHARLHAAGGAVYVSGMSIGDLIVNGNGNSEAHLTYSVTEGKLRDEDILHTLSAKSTSNPIPVFYREGTNWRSITPSAVGGLYARAIGSVGSPGIIAYNYNNAGTWSRVSITNNHFVLYHLIATNDVNNPYILVMGTNQYANKSAGKAGALVEIGTLTGLPFIEMTLVATMMYDHKNGYTNSLKAISTPTNNTDYEDWRFAKTLNPTTAAINDHNNLGGIYGGYPFYHSDQPITTTDPVTFHSVSSSTTLNVTGTSTLATTNITNGNISGTLNVTGTSTLATTNITIGNVSGALNVTGTSTLATTNMTIGNVSGALNVTGTSTLKSVNVSDLSSSNNLTVSGTSYLTDVNLTGGLVIGGNLTVNGTTTTVNSTVTILEDPIIFLGKSSPTVDDNKDRGIAFNYHTGTGAKVGYFGYDDSTGYFTYIPDATITSEVVAGTKGIIDANINWSNIIGAPSNTDFSSGGTINGNLTITGTTNINTALNVTGTGTFTNVKLGNINLRTGISSIQSSGTIDLSASNNLIYHINYVAASGTLTSGSINFTNGIAGEIVYIKVNSNGTYTFGSNMKFPSDIAPTPSANGKVDIYSFMCLSSTQYLGTFAFNFTG